MLNPGKMLASRQGFGCVYECVCGTIHLAVGPVDVKFTRESLMETYEMLREAVDQLEQRSSEVPRTGHVGIENAHEPLN